MPLIRKIRYVDQYGRPVAERKLIANGAASNTARRIGHHYSDQAAGIREPAKEDYDHIEIEKTPKELEEERRQKARKPMQRRPQMPQGGMQQGGGMGYYVGGARQPTEQEIQAARKAKRRREYQAETNQPDHSVLGGLLHSP